MCLYPKIIENRKYKANKKNGGVIPAIIDKRTLYVPIKCNKCMECMKAKAREWQVRLQQEIKNKENKKAHFITLTLSNESITKLSEEIALEGYERDNETATKAVRHFLERWRKKYKKSVKHWLVTELGHNGTENIHLHGIIWTDEKTETIEEIWKYGYIWDGTYVNEQTINYITKYVSKTDEIHKEYKSKILTSAGIGKEYKNSYNAEQNKYNGENTKEYYRTNTGHKISLPIYFRNKIYTEEQRERLWIKKLDEQTRYVDKKKIDISKGEEEYYKALETAREKNNRLGYLDDKINWERKIYERNRRNMMHKIRTVEKIRIEPQDIIQEIIPKMTAKEAW